MMSNKEGEMMGIHIRRAIKDDIQGIARCMLIVGKQRIKGYLLTKF